MKNVLKSNRKRDQMEERINKLENRNTEMIKVEEERGLRFLKSEETLC